jgi:aldehyde:ferredoxin oxidoreductase
MLPTRNFSAGQFERGIGTLDKDGVSQATVSDRACYGCPFCACSKFTEVKEGIYKGTRLEGPEYETLGLFGSNLDVDYLPAVIKANYLCDDLGMDTISAGNVIGFVMECVERGILTREDTDGLELRFGNYEAAIELLESIAYRRGFGDLCAEGVRAMAETLGRNTEEFAMHSKGLEFPAYDPRAGWGSAIAYSTTARGGCHRRAWPPAQEVLGGAYPFTTDGKAQLTKTLMDENCVMHSLLVCDFYGKFVPLSVDDFSQYLNAVTGLDYTAQDLLERADMIETLVRLINVREGFSAADDDLPRRFIEEGHANGPAQGRVIGRDNFLKMNRDFYELRGWDHDGMPTRETLETYGFEADERISIG